VPTIKPAQRHKQNTKTIKIHKNKTINRKNIAGKKQYKRSTGAKTLYPEKT
jgi:hypothetical protein